MEIQEGAMLMHEFAIPVVHIAEVAVVLWVANKMIKSEEEGSSNIPDFPSTVDGSIWLRTEFHRNSTMMVVQPSIEAY